MQGMLEIYGLLPLGVLFIVFVRFAVQDGNIMDWIPSVLRSIKHAEIRYFLFKPLAECPICMASVWGSAFYFSCLPWITPSFAQWVLFCCCLSGLMWLVVQVLGTQEIEFKYINNGTNMVKIKYRKLGNSEAEESREFEFPFDIKIHISNLLKDSDCYFLYWIDCTHHKERMNIMETARLIDDPEEFRVVVDWAVNQFEWLHVESSLTINIFEFSKKEHAEEFKINQERYFIENVR